MDGTAFRKLVRDAGRQDSRGEQSTGAGRGDDVAVWWDEKNQFQGQAEDALSEQ